MSKLKELKQVAKPQKNGFDFTYVFLAVAVLFVVVVVYFSFFTGTTLIPLEKLVDDDPSEGPVDANVVIVEFSDFECPACGQAYSILKRIRQEYASSVRFVYRDFPLSGIHPFAQKAAEAAQCANLQGNFWQYHDFLFEHQSALAVQDLKGYAQTLGLDTAAFNSCLDSGAAVAEVAKDSADARDFGVKGTPTFFINSVAYSNMTYDQFIAVLDTELAKK